MTEEATEGVLFCWQKPRRELKLQEVEIAPAVGSTNEIIQEHIIEIFEIFHTLQGPKRQLQTFYFMKTLLKISRQA